MHLQQHTSCSMEVCCQAPACVFFCMVCLHWPGQSPGIVQVHEVKGNLSTAGLQRVFERCTSASRGPFPVQCGSGARVRSVYRCTVFTGACTVFTGVQCSPVHGVHGCTMFYGSSVKMGGRGYPSSILIAPAPLGPFAGCYPRIFGACGRLPGRPWTLGRSS